MLKMLRYCGRISQWSYRLAKFQPKIIDYRLVNGSLPMRYYQNLSMNNINTNIFIVTQLKSKSFINLNQKMSYSFSTQGDQFKRKNKLRTEQSQEQIKDNTFPSKSKIWSFLKQNPALAQDQFVNYILRKRKIYLGLLNNVGSGWAKIIMLVLLILSFGCFIMIPRIIDKWWYSIPDNESNKQLNQLKNIIIEKMKMNLDEYYRQYQKMNKQIKIRYQINQQSLQLSISEIKSNGITLIQSRDHQEMLKIFLASLYQDSSFTQASIKNEQIYYYALTTSKRPLIIQQSLQELQILLNHILKESQSSWSHIKQVFGLKKETTPIIIDNFDVISQQIDLMANKQMALKIINLLRLLSQEKQNKIIAFGYNSICGKNIIHHSSIKKEQLFFKSVNLDFNTLMKSFSIDEEINELAKQEQRKFLKSLYQMHYAKFKQLNKRIFQTCKQENALLSIKFQLFKQQEHDYQLLRNLWRQQFQKYTSAKISYFKAILKEYSKQNQIVWRVLSKIMLKKISFITYYKLNQFNKIFDKDQRDVYKKLCQDKIIFNNKFYIDLYQDIANDILQDKSSIQWSIFEEEKKKEPDQQVIKQNIIQEQNLIQGREFVRKNILSQTTKATLDNSSENKNS